MFRDAWTPTFLLVSCEHGGNEVPDAHAALFRGHGDVLASHRGLDLGALGVAQRLAARLAAPLVVSTVTRLLVDLNRSLGHPGLFSEFTRGLSPAEREAIVAAHYRPYRASVARVVTAAIAAGHRVLHVGVHTCADDLDGCARDLDVAFLFDDGRAHEHDVAVRWREAILARAPDLRVPFNEPYHGRDDGLTTALRAAYPERHYAGIEVEIVNTRVRDAPAQRAHGDLLAESLPAAT